VELISRKAQKFTKFTKSRCARHPQRVQKDVSIYRYHSFRTNIKRIFTLILNFTDFTNESSKLTHHHWSFLANDPSLWTLRGEHNKQVPGSRPIACSVHTSGTTWTTMLATRRAESHCRPKARGNGLAD